MVPFKTIEILRWYIEKCGPKSPKSFDYAFSLQNGLVTLKWSGGLIYPLSLSSSASVRKWDMSRLQAFLGLSIGPKPLLTIVPEFGETIEKTSIAMVNQWKNIQWWWLRGSKTIEKPLIAMVPPKKFITIPSLWKNDHRWSLLRSNLLIVFFLETGGISLRVLVIRFFTRHRIEILI